MAAKKLEGSARERLLAAANELFYEEGVHIVGIDRVIERAGVAKASLYSAFGSKEELVRAYLETRLAARRQRVSDRIAQHHAPRERILAVFDLLAERATEPGFRGCAFVNASAEGSREESRVTDIVASARAWMLGLFTELARDLGAADPESMGRQLGILYDGAIVSASIERDPRAALEARAAADTLIAATRPAHRAAPRRAARR